MLIANKNYLFQLVRASDGNRAEPFIATPAELQESLVKDYNSDTSKQFYVLVLADLALDLKPQEFVSKFPLYTLESWTNLTFNQES